MTDNVVSLRAEAPLDMVLACDCGGTTFFVRSTGVLICAACDSEMQDDVTGVDWGKVEQVDREARAIRQFASEDLAFRRVLKQAQLPMTAALVVMNKDGKTAVWSEGAGGDANVRAWFQRRVDDLMGQLE